jgi:hypothetical protein
MAEMEIVGTPEAVVQAEKERFRHRPKRPGPDSSAKEIQEYVLRRLRESQTHMEEDYVADAARSKRCIELVESDERLAKIMYEYLDLTDRW